MHDTACSSLPNLPREQQFLYSQHHASTTLLSTSCTPLYDNTLYVTVAIKLAYNIPQATNIIPGTFMLEFTSTVSPVPSRRAAAITF